MQTRTRFALLAAAICIAAFAEAAPAPERFTPAGPAGQKVDGMLGRRIEANTSRRLRRVNVEALLRGFEQRPGGQAWIGEHAGKFLDAASDALEYRHDAELAGLAAQVATRLRASQLPDGYLGTYLPEHRWTSWDVWVHKYAMLGLLRYGAVTKDAGAVEAARLSGALLASEFASGKRDLIKAGTHGGMASTSVLEAACRLHAATGDASALDLAYAAVRAWESPEGPRMLSGLLAGRGVEQTGNAKAYELLSNLYGGLQMYRITADPLLLLAAERAWNDIFANHSYITGTTSAAEYFRPHGELAASEPARVGEGCVTTTWLQMTFDMFRLTGDLKYADEVERIVFNHLLAAQEESTGNICYFTPLDGRKNPGPGISCCVSSIPRGIAMIPRMVWGIMDGGPAALLYTSGEGVVLLPSGTVRLRNETTFPESGKMRITVDPEQRARFALRLRVPAWSGPFVARVAGSTYRGVPGTFLTIDREWKHGDTVEVSTGMRVRRLSGGTSYPGHVALARGPQVLALERSLNPDVDWLHLASPDATVSLQSAAAQLPQDWTGRQAYSVPGSVSVPAAGSRPGAHRRTKLILVPFADAMEMRVWLPAAPQPVTAVPATAFAHKEKVSPTAKHGHLTGSITDGRTDTWAATRFGVRAPGEVDRFTVELATAAKIRRVIFRHGEMNDAGGWFDASTTAPAVLIRRAGSDEWVRAGELPGYRATAEAKPAFGPGQGFVLNLPQTEPVTGIRVEGRAARAFVGCSELAAE